MVLFSPKPESVITDHNGMASINVGDHSHMTNNLMFNASGYREFDFYYDADTCFAFTAEYDEVNAIFIIPLYTLPDPIMSTVVPHSYRGPLKVTYRRTKSLLRRSPNQLEFAYYANEHGEVDIVLSQVFENNFHRLIEEFKYDNGQSITMARKVNNPQNGLRKVAELNYSKRPCKNNWFYKRKIKYDRTIIKRELYWVGNEQNYERCWRSVHKTTNDFKINTTHYYRDGNTYVLDQDNFVNMFRSNLNTSGSSG
jgi:hypothetical protein